MTLFYPMTKVLLFCELREKDLYAISNKHKFVRKVAKKNILLISFKFNINISSVHLTGGRKIKSS